MAPGIATVAETEEGRESKKEIQTLISELAQAGEMGGEERCADVGNCC